MTMFDSRIEVQTQDGDSHQEAAGRQPSQSKGPVRAKHDTEVTPKRKKRRFFASDKLRILGLADACTKHGEMGALLRREGLYSNQIAAWRLLRDQGELVALTDKKRGRKPADSHPLIAKLAASEKLAASLTRKLEKAQEIIDVQKKFAALFGTIIKLPEHLEETL
jgi:transposase